MTEMKHIHVCALGGTIAMSSNAAASTAGVKPVLTGDDLLAAVPEIADIAIVSAETLTNEGSANLTLEIAKTVIRHCRTERMQCVDGFVVTQGTDTMEEMSFLLSLLWDIDAPLVVTGAMINPGQVDTDGPRNLKQAVSAAKTLAQGVYVLMNQRLHDPLWVRKAHASDVDAFQSSDEGIGFMRGLELTIMDSLAPRPQIEVESIERNPPVAVLNPQLDDEGWQLAAVKSGSFEGLVVASFGGGHVSEVWADALGEFAAKIPVILTSRIGVGAIYTDIYGYKGAEIDLINRGLIPAGALPANKVRILLKLMLAAGVEDIKAAFASF